MEGRVDSVGEEGRIVIGEGELGEDSVKGGEGWRA